MVIGLLRNEVASLVVDSPTDSESLSLKPYKELESNIRGALYYRGEENFILHSKIFNGDVKSPAVLLVRPFDTEDVSNIVKFCSKHALSVSVKGAGLGTHGQAIQGKIILDLSLLTGIDVDAPNQTGGYTSLKDANFSKRSDKMPEPCSTDRTQGHTSYTSSLGGDFSQGNQPVIKAFTTSGALADSQMISPGNVASMDSKNPTQGNQKSGDPFGYLSNEPPTMPSSQFPGDIVHTANHPAASSSALDIYGRHSTHADLQFSSEFYTPPRVKLQHLHAYVTFGAGIKQQEVDAYTAAHPLPAVSLNDIPCYTPYFVPFASHPGGTSIVLLGGFGFLSRLHGLSSDNLLEAEMVLADGSIIIVNENDYSDLWWAIRGAGTAFGVVTRFKMKAFPVPIVFAGNLLYKFRRSTASSLFKHFRDCVKGVPRELYANLILTAGPVGDALIAIELCFLGTQETGGEILQAIASWGGEQCLLNDICEKAFVTQQDSFAHLLNGQRGRKWFMRSDLLQTLSDEIIHDTVARFADTPKGCTWIFELAGGCISDTHKGCIPAIVREATWAITAFHQWELEDEDPLCVTSAENWMKDILGPVSLGGPLPSFYGIHEAPERVTGSFGENWTRLCEIKRTYDPNGMFSHNFWPVDKNGQPKRTVATITKY